MDFPKNFNETDWDKVKKRWEAWWECGIYDRALLRITAPKIKLTKDNEVNINENLYKEGWGSRHAIWELRPEKEKEDNAEIEWLDIDYMIKRSLYEINNTFYFGESVPIFTTDWTFGHALLFGSKIKKITKDAVWMEPLPLVEDKYPIIEFNPANYWWNWIQESTTEAVKNSKKYYFVQPAHGANSGDTLGMLVGIEKLLTHIKDSPDWVKTALETISNVIIDLYDRLFHIINLSGLEGFVNYVGCWSPFKTITIDCDLGSMISEETHKNIFLPSLIKVMNIAKHRIYHLDGTAQLHLLDTLLNIKDLHAIQWAPGVGKEEIMQWLPIIEKVQSKKKSIVLYCTSQEVIPLLKKISPEGLCISVSCSDEEEARALIGKVEKLH